MSLNKQDILQADDVVKELVHVPEWGGDVYVRNMTGDGRDEWETHVIGLREEGKRLNMRGVRAKLASLTVCDENGNLLFSKEDIDALGKRSAAALQRVWIVGQRLSALSNQDVQELKDGLQKNPSEDSVSV
jgi:hypothetical protein